MNKNIKKIIAMTLTLCAVSAVCGVKNLNLSGEGTVAAFASDKSSLNLESISLSTGKIDFSSDVTSYKVYYNKAVKNIDIKVSPEGSDKRIRVTINDESVSSDDSYKKNFKLSVGENIFKIKIENRDDESQSKTYTLKAYRGTDENDQEIEQDLYIDYLTINGTEIDLSKDKEKKVYDYKVDKDVKEAKIVIEPDQKYYTVKIGDDTYEGEESIKKTFTLTEGKNEIKIKLTDGEDEEKKQRTYTLNIYRGVDIPTSSTTTNNNTTSTGNNTTNTGNNTGTNNSISTGTTNSSSSTTNTVSNSGKWQQNSAGKWYYVDSNGNAAKNKWFFVQGDGTMATGWVSFGGSWYYLNDDGTMATEWLNNGGKWYYLGSDGAMKTGWVQLSGNWYYLYSDGSMACNTTIDSYKLGSDGAWIK